MRFPFEFMLALHAEKRTYMRKIKFTALLTVQDIDNSSQRQTSF